MKNKEIMVYAKKIGRPAKAITDERTRQVAELILKGTPRQDIFTYCVTEFGVERSTVVRQIHRANLYIRENYSIDAQNVVTTHLNMYYELYTLWKTVDGSTAIKSLNSIEKLLNLYKPETLVQNNTLHLNLKDLTINELKELLNKDE